MFTVQEYLDWRGSDLTQELHKDIVNAAQTAGAEILNRRRPDESDDTYLRGFIAGLSATLAFKPELVQEDNGIMVKADVFAEDTDEA